MHIVIKSFIVAGGSKQSNIMNYVLSTSRTSGKKYRRNGVGPNSEGLPFGSPSPFTGLTDGTTKPLLRTNVYRLLPQIKGQDIGSWNFKVV